VDSTVPLFLSDDSLAGAWAVSKVGILSRKCYPRVSV
jgi:hypothetical protein